MDGSVDGSVTGQGSSACDLSPHVSNQRGLLGRNCADTLQVEQSRRALRSS